MLACHGVFVHLKYTVLSVKIKFLTQESSKMKFYLEQNYYKRKIPASAYFISNSPQLTCNYINFMVNMSWAWDPALTTTCTYPGVIAWYTYTSSLNFNFPGHSYKLFKPHYPQTKSPDWSPYFSITISWENLWSFVNCHNLFNLIWYGYWEKIYIVWLGARC